MRSTLRLERPVNRATSATSQPSIRSFTIPRLSGGSRSRISSKTSSRWANADAPASRLAFQATTSLDAADRPVRVALGRVMVGGLAADFVNGDDQEQLPQLILVGKS